MERQSSQFQLLIIVSIQQLRLNDLLKQSPTILSNHNFSPPLWYYKYYKLSELTIVKHEG